METIIGLGEAGCRIADCFAQYPQYEIVKFDIGISDIQRAEDNMMSIRSFSIEEQTGHEEYENYFHKNRQEIKSFLEGIDGKVLFVVGGSGDISGGSLVLLEQLRDREVNVLYVEPDYELLNEEKSLQERSAYYILQEYARSGVYERLYIISNPELEKILDNVPIIGYYNKLNDLIVSTMHMINVFEHSQSVVGNFSKVHELSRIATIGISNLKKEKKLFFPLDNVKEMVYYYAISRKKLETDGGLSRKISDQIKTMNDYKISYGIYPTDYSDDYVYCVAFSSYIQYRKNEKKSLQLEDTVVK